MTGQVRKRSQRVLNEQSLEDIATAFFGNALSVLEGYTRQLNTLPVCPRGTRNDWENTLAPDENSRRADAI